MIYGLRSLRGLKRSLHDAGGSADGAGYWQAGKSVGSIQGIEPAAAIVRRFADAARTDRIPH